MTVPQVCPENIIITNEVHFFPNKRQRELLEQGKRASLKMQTELQQINPKNL